MTGGNGNNLVDAVGDAVLRVVASRLQDAVRASDTASRGLQATRPEVPKATTRPVAEAFFSTTGPVSGPGPRFRKSNTISQSSFVACPTKGPPFPVPQLGGRCLVI